MNNVISQFQWDMTSYTIWDTKLGPKLDATVDAKAWLYVSNSICQRNKEIILMASNYWEMVNGTI